VKPGVMEWLLLRLPRSAAAIREAAKRLDDLSIAAKGHLTRATVAAAVKDLLSDLPDSGPDCDDDSAKPVPPASPPGGATR
jgi:chromosomal replication initiation ATPase DnaA